jgi:hypothetical protein
MIPNHATEFGEVLQAVDTFIGVRTIPNEVAQAPDFIDGGGIVEDGFESGVIGMDV